MTDAPIVPVPPPEETDDEVTLSGGERASDADLIAGIVAQTRFDCVGLAATEIAERLRERFTQTDVAVDEVALAAFAQDIADTPR